MWVIWQDKVGIKEIVIDRLSHIKPLSEILVKKFYLGKNFELIEKSRQYPNNEVKMYFVLRDNKTDEAKLYESGDIQIGMCGKEVSVRTELLIK